MPSMSGAASACGLAVGDEAVGWLVGRYATLDAIAWDDPDVEAAHASGELCSDHVPVVERDLEAAPSENLLYCT